MNRASRVLFFLVLFLVWNKILGEQCGRQAGGQFCPNSLCCSQWGWCGDTAAYCGTGCQSHCSPSGGSPGGSGSGNGVASVITNGLYDRFFANHNSASCPANGFYSYNAFLTAAAAFSGFGTTGDATTVKRELAAFFAHISHETSGGCYKEEIDQSFDYCSPSAEWPCAPGKKYYGRGPIQISWNYNYGPAGKAIGFDGINNPERVATDAVISFKTAVWFWMQGCHAAIVNNQGFGATTRIINGGIECDKGSNAAQNDRISLYKSFCQTLGVQPGDNLTC